MKDNLEKIRVLAWRVLIKYANGRLPVDVKTFARDFGVSFASYNSGEELIENLGLTILCKNDAFTARHPNGYLLFFNQAIEPKERIRFAIAHELGHIALGHAFSPMERKQILVTTCNNGTMQEKNYQEFAANFFASQILAPPCILQELGVTSASEIARLCGTSEEASVFLAQRLALSSEREAWYRHPLERQVRATFQDYIVQYRKAVWHALQHPHQR